MSRDLDLLKLAKDRWVTGVEAAQALGAQHPGYMRECLGELHKRGFMKLRIRKPAMREDGTYPAGQWPAEFRVSTEWGGLDG